MVRSIISIVFFGLLVSCQPETIYDVGTLKPNADGEKTELKDDLQFMSIAYRDLFEEEVPPGVLEFMRTAYISLGDKELVVDRGKAMLSSPDVEIPSQTDMLGAKKNLFRRLIKNFSFEILQVLRRLIG